MTVYSEGINAKASTDTGAVALTLTSTEEEVKKARRIVITDIATNAMLMTVTLEREEIVKNLPLEVVADLMPERLIELDVEIPAGQTLSIILKPQAAGSQGALDGWLEYEITG